MKLKRLFKREMRRAPYKREFFSEFKKYEH